MCAAVISSGYIKLRSTQAVISSRPTQAVIPSKYTCTAWCCHGCGCRASSPSRPSEPPSTFRPSDPLPAASFLFRPSDTRPSKSGALTNDHVASAPIASANHNPSSPSLLKWDPARRHSLLELDPNHKTFPEPTSHFSPTALCTTTPHPCFVHCGPRIFHFPSFPLLRVFYPFIEAQLRPWRAERFNPQTCPNT